MSKPNTTCRVCGTEYFCCGDSKAINSWKAMTCTPECFKEYMRRIEDARNPKTVKIVEEVKVVETENIDAKPEPTIKMKYNKKKPTVEVETDETNEIIED